MANVLFVCVENAGRPRLSEALFTQRAAGCPYIPGKVEPARVA